MKYIACLLEHPIEMRTCFTVFAMIAFVFETRFGTGDRNGGHPEWCQRVTSILKKNVEKYITSFAGASSAALNR